MNTDLSMPDHCPECLEPRAKCRCPKTVTYASNSTVAAGDGSSPSAGSADSQRVERTMTADEWRTKAHNLWQLLDDIDTYFDMLKPEMEAFERMVNAKCQERHKELESDGYRLYPPKKKLTDPTKLNRGNE